MECYQPDLSSIREDNLLSLKDTPLKGPLQISKGYKNIGHIQASQDSSFFSAIELHGLISEVFTSSPHDRAL